jgi:DDE domain
VSGVSGAQVGGGKCWSPGVSDDGLAQRGHDVDAVLAGGVDVAADVQAILGGTVASADGRKRQYGQVIDVLVAEHRDLAAIRRFFIRALEHGPRPTEVSTDRAPAYPLVFDELLPSACHVTEQYATIPPKSPCCAEPT